jgi:hypothetical protein
LRVQAIVVGFFGSHHPQNGHPGLAKFLSENGKIGSFEGGNFQNANFESLDDREFTQASGRFCVPDFDYYFSFPLQHLQSGRCPRSRPSSVLVKRIIKKSRTRVCFDSNRPNPSDNFKISTRPFCTPKYDRNMEMDFEKGLKILRPSFSPLLNVCVCLSMQFVQVSPKYGPITLSSLRPLS